MDAERQGRVLLDGAPSWIIATLSGPDAFFASVVLFFQRGSVDGIRVPDLQNYPYSAAKAGVHMLSRHMAHHLAKESINVNAIAPGLFPSQMTKFLFDNVPDPNDIGYIPLGRAGRPDDIAGLAIYLASRAGAYLTGGVIPVDGGVATHG